MDLMMLMAQALLDDGYRDEANFIDAMAEECRRKLAGDDAKEIRVCAADCSNPPLFELLSAVVRKI